MCSFSLSLFDHVPAPGGPEFYKQQTPAHRHPLWDDCPQGTASSHPSGSRAFPQPRLLLGACGTKRLQARALSLLAAEHLPAPSLALGWGLRFFWQWGDLLPGPQPAWLPMGSCARSAATGISALSIAGAGTHGRVPVTRARGSMSPSSGMGHIIPSHPLKFPCPWLPL